MSEQTHVISAVIKRWTHEDPDAPPAWSAAIGVWRGHPWYGLAKEAIPTAPLPDPVDDDTWWIGFDCAHAGDLLPAFPQFGGVLRDGDFVRSECNRLAAQALAAVGGEVIH